MDTFLVLGSVGTFFTLVAYLPQITHLIKEKCSAGISITTYGIWILSSVLMLVNALHIKSIIFTVQQAVNLVAIITIIFFANKFKGSFCESHKPR